MIDSKDNYEPIRSLWKQHKVPEGHSITAFKINPTTKPEDWLIDQLYNVDLHYGEIPTRRHILCSTLLAYSGQIGLQRS